MTETAGPRPAHESRVHHLDRTRVGLVAAVAGAVLGVAVATSRYGVGLTPDSVTYLTGADSISEGKGYVDLSGTAIGSFAPGYPAILALPLRAGIDELAASRAIAVLGLVATVLLGHVLLRRHVRAPAIQIAGTIVLACSAVMLEIYSKALSEHLFVPIVAAFLIVCEELLRRPRHLGLLAAAVVAVWAAFYLRYSGLVLIAVAAAVIVIASWRTEPVRSCVRASLFCLAALAAPAIWMLRNRDEFGNPFGRRVDASESLADNAYAALNEVSQWLATDVTPPVGRALVSLMLLGVIVLIGVSVARGRVAVPPDWRSLIPIALFVVGYTAFLITSASQFAIASLNSRLMLPIFVPVVVLGAWLYEQVLGHIETPRLRTVVLAAGGFFVACNVAWFAGRAVNLASDGAGGYAVERWQESEILADVARLDLAIPTFSNDPQPIEHFLDLHVGSSPSRTFFNSPEATDHLATFRSTIGCAGGGQLVWFTPGGRPYRYSLEELSRELVIEPVVERADGAIYRISLAPGAPQDC